MPRTPAPLPSSLGEVFLCREALAAGATEARLRARDLHAPHRGVRMRPHADAPARGTPNSARAGRDEPRDDETARERAGRIQAAVRRRARAYAVVMPRGAFVAGRSALALYGLPLERLDSEDRAGDGILSGDEDLCVAVRGPQRAPRARGVRGRRLSGTLVGTREVDGLAATSPATTWAMLAGELDEPSLVRLGDAIVRVPRDDRGRLLPERQLATIDQLHLAALAPRRRGRDALLAALERVRIGSSSPLETDWRLGAEDAGLPVFALDVEIRDATGRLLGIADAAQAQYRTIVEVEGDHHRTSRAQWNRDIRKHADYAANGWEVVRLTGAHIRGRAPQAPALLREVLVRRGWRP